MSSKAREVIRARIRDRIRAAQHPDVAPGLGHVRLDEPAPKTKAELQDELTAAGVEFPKRATKADLEALAAAPGETTPDLDAVVAEDIAEQQSSK